MPRPVGTLAEPSDDPKINERRRRAREQARDRAATAKQLKAKGIGQREELDRAAAVAAAAAAAAAAGGKKDPNCEEQLAEVKKQLRRKDAQIKFLADNIKKVDAGATPVPVSGGKASSVSSPPKYVKVAKSRIAELKAKGKAIIAERNAVKNAGSLLGAVMKRAATPSFEGMKTDTATQNVMATKLQNAMRNKMARDALLAKKGEKRTLAGYLARKNAAPRPRMTSPERRARDKKYKE